MKKLLFIAMLLAGASAFAGQSDTTFIQVSSNKDPNLNKYIFLPSFDMGEVDSILYIFYKVEDSVIALPMDLPAAIMVYPQNNHQYKLSEFIHSERYKGL